MKTLVLFIIHQIRNSLVGCDRRDGWVGLALTGTIAIESGVGLA